MQNEVSQDTTKLAAQAKSGASWFYWIAGLSLVNSAVILLGSDWGFLAGLGITQVVDAIVLEIAPGAGWLAFTLDLLIAGACVGIGVWAHRSTTGYITGMALYGLDSLLFLMASDWLGMGFHGLVLFFLWGGLQARRQLDRLAATEPPRMPMAA